MNNNLWLHTAEFL